MADEISMNGSFALANGSLTVEKSADDLITQTTAKYHAGVQNIGTSEEALVLGDVTTPGLCYFENLDATNYLTIGETTNNDIIKLKPGEFCFVRLGITAPYAIANTAACDLNYIILED